MSDDRALIAAAMAALHLTSQAQLAAIIDSKPRTVAGWACGDSPMPGPVRVLLRVLVADETARVLLQNSR